MRKINYPLLVSDFDGTLVKDDGTIDEQNKKAIIEYVDAGGIFVISTGRLPMGILPRAKELGLKGVVCCCQGAIILDLESDKIICDEKIPYKTTLSIVKKMEEMGLHIHIYDFYNYYSNMDDEALAFYENVVKVKAKLVTEKPLSQFIEENKFCSYKILAMIREEENEKICQELAQENFEGCAITKSGNFLAEVINANYSKGTAIQFLADYYGIPIEKTIAIGDQHNDLPMLEKAGLGIAVNNADAYLKERAKYICKHTNNEGAVAEVIEKFGFIK